MTIERKPTRYAHSDGHTDVCYSQSGDKLITCGTDGDIRIWSGFDDDDPTQSCVGEWSLCVQHNDGHLYVATDNNNVQLLTYPEGERDGILTKFTAPVNHMVISKDKKFIAVASEDTQLKIISLNNTKDEKNFSGLNGPPLSIALCPNTKFIAVSAGDGYLRVFDIESREIVHETNCVPKTNSFMNTKALCRMDFDPKFGHYLAYPENSFVNILNTLDWSIKCTLSCDNDDQYSIVKYSPCGNYISAASVKGSLAVWEITTSNLITSTNHPKSTAICAMVWNPSGNGEIAYCDVEGQLGIVTNCSSTISDDLTDDFLDDQCMETADDKVSSNADDDNDEDNENAVSLEKLKKEIMGNESDHDNDVASIRSSTPRPKTPEIPLQMSFMPSSTPEHLDPRYMCWNDVGVVRCYGYSLDEDAETGKYIEVEFNDVSFHSSMMLQNFQNYFMGSLSVSALVVANSNQITVVPLASSSKEWNLTVEDGEEIVCIATSKNLICFGTTNYFVRVCSIYGIQKAIFSVPGPLVSMAAYKNYLLVAYHLGSIRKGDQCINVMLVKLEGFSVESKELNISLRPESQLQWIGFSDMGTPAIMDSTGILSIYPVKSNLWIPICDTAKLSKSPSDGFFVIAVYETLQTVRGIRCKGSMYPSFTPRPTQIEHPLQPLFIELSTEKSTLETNLFNWSILQSENMEKKFKETALKAFALACKSNFEQRALELIEMLDSEQLLTLAVKYATILDKKRLAEKLNNIKSQYGLQSDELVMTPPVNKKLTLNSSSKSASKNKISATRNDDLNNSENNKANINSDVHTPNTSDTNISFNTQESLFSQASPANPFAKNVKQSKSNLYSPLTFTDKFSELSGKGNKNQNEASDKRKRTETPNVTEEPKEKQRKLDKFMFSKN